MTSYSESKIQQFWNDNNVFNKSIENNKNKQTFVFYDGPPFATGLPHYGHILAGFIKDTIGRFQTQNGFHVPRNAGWDCHGLPIEYEIEKEYKIKTKQQIEDWGIDNYNNACKNIVMKYSSDWKSIMNRLGRWVDFDNDYKTMDFDFMNSVWWVFSELHKKGLVYPSYKVLPYSVACKTPLSNFETQQNYQEVEDITIFVKFETKDYKFNDQLVNLLVWTTTPWTLPSNLLIAINKNIEYVLTEYNNEYFIIAKNLVDKLNKLNKKNELKIIESICIDQLIGQKYNPLFNCYPIDQLNKPTMAYTVVHGDFVTDSDGTGLVHIAPSYGDEDYQLCIKTQIINKMDELFMSIDDDGYFKDLSGLAELNGIYYKNKETNNGNLMIINKLKQNNRLFFQNRCKHNYPFCWRSDTPLMYRAIKSWFVNVESIKDRMVELNKTINWFPKFVGEKRFHDWLSDARDWCIARNRYWGTPLPIWVNINDQTDFIVINSAQELASLTDTEITDLHRDKIDHLIIKKEGQTYRRTTEVFDCWFESGSMPYASIGYPHNKNKLIMPANFIAEGIDQTRGWFYTLLVISTALFDKVPFQNVIVNGLIMTTDPDTKKPVKMSKRLKNYPDPLNIVEEHGSDALRLYLLNSPATRGDKLVFSEDGVKKIVKDVIITLNNSLSFLLEYKHIISLKEPPMKLYDVNNYETDNPMDTYAIKYIGQIIDKIKLYLNSYDIPRAIDMINQFVEMLSNQFIKFNRQSLKGKNDDKSWLSSISTLNILLEYFAVVSASLMPFFAEHLFTKLNNNILSVHLTQFEDFKLPTLNENQNKMADEMLHILEIINLVNKIRSKNGLSMKTPLKEIIIESTNEIINIVNKYSSFILDELNVLGYKTKTFEISNIDITVRPNFNVIKQKYSNIKLIESTIKKLTNEQKRELFCDNTIEIDNITIDPLMCKVLIEPIKLESFYSEYTYANDTNYSVYLNSIIDDEVLALGYAKKIASTYQKMRRDAKLHQWDKIKLAYQGNLEYDIENEKLINVIYTTCGYKTEKISTINEDQIIFKLNLNNDNENTNTTLYLLKP